MASHTGPVDEEALMGDSVHKTCSRCGEEIVVMCAGEYLSITDDELDFVLHVDDRDSRSDPRKACTPALAAATTIASPWALRFEKQAIRKEDKT